MEDPLYTYVPKSQVILIIPGMEKALHVKLTCAMFSEGPPSAFPQLLVKD
jgi:hypothetical protein